jgi:glycerophosphoryl diester phosphodiesterase
MWIMFLVISILATLILAAAFLPWLTWWWRWSDRSADERIKFLAVETERLIVAHATGGSKLGSYPNAIQCLDDWYASGVRWFEFDLHWTRDGHLVGLHDWGPTFRRWFDPGGLPLKWKLAAPLIRHRGLPLATFQALHMRADLTPIDPDALKDWLARHHDAWLVTDIKHNNPAALHRLAEVFGPLTQQVLAQVFSVEEISLARDLGYGRIGWANYVPKLPIERLPALLQDQPVDLVVLNRKTIRDPATWPELSRIRSMGMDLWLFTINDPEELATLPDSVNGIITDRLLPD